MANRADRMLKTFQVGFGAGQAIGKRIDETGKRQAISEAYDTSKAPTITEGQETEQGADLRAQTAGIPSPGEDPSITKAFQADQQQFQVSPTTTAFDHYRWAQDQRGKMAAAGVKSEEIDTIIANQNKARLARGAEEGELAAQAMEAGDLETAQRHLMLSNANYGTGKSVTPSIVDGQLYAAWSDEDTGKATTPPIPMSPENIRNQMRYLADPSAAAAHDLAINADMRAEETHEMDMRYGDDKNLAGLMKDTATANYYNAKTQMDRVKFNTKMSSGSGKYGWESGEALQKRLGGLEDSLYKNLEKGTGSATFTALQEVGKSHMVLDHSANILKANPTMNNQQAIDAGAELATIMHAASLPEPTSFLKDIFSPKEIKSIEEQGANMRDVVANMIDVNDETGIATLTLPSGKQMIAPPGMMANSGIDYVKMSDYRPYPGGSNYNSYISLMESKGQDQVMVQIPEKGAAPVKGSRLYEEPGAGSSSAVVSGGGGIPGGGGGANTTIQPPPRGVPEPAPAPAAASPRVPKADPTGAVPANLSTGAIPSAAPAAPAAPSARDQFSTGTQSYAGQGVDQMYMLKAERAAEPVLQMLDAGQQPTQKAIDAVKWRMRRTGLEPQDFPEAFRQNYLGQ